MPLTAEPVAPPAPAASAVDVGSHAAERHLTASDAPATPTAAPTASGPWEKPAWAIPDNEIKVHRGPDQQDDKIVIPPETP